MKGNGIVRRMSLFAFFLSGASALIYEVVWTRALGLIVGSTVYALATMLATFMAGLAIGGYIGGRIADRGKRLLLYFGMLELGIGFFGVLTIPAVYSLPPIYYWIYHTFHLNAAVYFVMQFMLCASIMIIPTTLMGATFPVVARHITGEISEMGKGVGNAYSFNTLGAIVGSLAAGFLLVPVVGIRNASLCAAGLNVFVGALLVIISETEKTKTVLITSIAVFAPAILLERSVENDFTLGTFYYAGRFNTYEELKHADILQNVLFEKDYAQGTIRALSDNGFLTIQHGGKMEGTSASDIANTFMLTALPAAVYGRTPEDMLVVGLGAGVTTWFSKQLSPRIDVVEINPGVVEAVSRYGLPGTLTDVSLIVDDARRHLAMTDKKYDIITSEPSVPSESMSANLFTREFYETAASHLKEGGIFCQWMPAWAMTRRDTHIAAKTFVSVFDNAYLWVVLLTNDFIMVGSKGRMLSGADEIVERVKKLKVIMPRPSEGAEHGRSVRDMCGYLKLLRTPEGMRELLERSDLPLITDDKPYLEFAVTKNLLYGNDFRALRQ